VLEKLVTLKDAQKVLIRSMQPGDAELSFDFFKSLPPADRKYLRRDVTHYRVVRQRLDAIDRGRARVLVAVHGGRIIADGCLQLEGHGWGDNVAEIRLIIGAGWKRKGLGMLMAQELFHLAAEHRVDRIVVRMMRPQKAARAIFRKLGFTDEFVIPKHVRDLSGDWQDMVIMRCNLEDLWNEMEILTATMDVPRHG